MPRVNIYIRQDDEELWDLIENKSEWISDNLNRPQKEMAVKQFKKKVREINKESAICLRHGLPTDTRGKCMQC